MRHFAAERGEMGGDGAREREGREKEKRKKRKRRKGNLLQSF